MVIWINLEPLLKGYCHVIWRNPKTSLQIWCYECYSFASKKKKTFYINTVECLRLSLLIVCPFYYAISNILVAFHREKTFAYNFLTKMWQGFLWQCPFNRGKYINARSATKPWGNSHSEQTLIVRTCRVRIHSLISLKVCKIYIINRYSYIALIISNKTRRNFFWERFSISLETMFFGGGTFNVYLVTFDAGVPPSDT